MLKNLQFIKIIINTYNINKFQNKWHQSKKWIKAIGFAINLETTLTTLVKLDFLTILVLFIPKIMFNWLLTQKLSL
jgi:hypothetical protein